MLTLWQDIRYAARNLRRSPGFTVAAVATLTLAIGASTAAFAVISSILLEPLPFDDSDQLINLTRTIPERGITTLSISPRELDEIRTQTQTLEGLAGLSSSRANRSYDGPPEMIQFATVTAKFFDVLGVRPVLGRLFSDEDNLPDGTRPAVISFGEWQEKWGGSVDVVGETILLEEQPVMTIIGVLPPSFRNPGGATLPPPVWTSRRIDPEGRSGGGLQVFGRISSGGTIASVQAEIDTIAARITASLPESAAPRSFLVRSLRERVVGNSRQTIFILAASVGAVLLIGVLNIVNLQAARVSKRGRELSIRAALGASRSRLVRQMIVEAIVLTGSGAALGLLVVLLVRDAALVGIPRLLPRWDDIAIDGRVFAFAVGVSLVAGVVIGVVPALRASRPNLNETLKDGTPGATEGRQQRWLRSTLTMIEMSLAVVLLVAAGLLIHSFWLLISVDPGFDPEGLRTARVTLPRRYADPAVMDRFFGQLEERLRAVPGVDSVTVTNFLPMEGGVTMGGLRAEGVEERGAGGIQEIGADYGTVMRIPLLAGRWINKNDVDARAPVVVISDSMARQFWSGQRPIGKRMRLGSNGPWMTVIGMVPDVLTSMTQGATARLHVPYTSDLMPSFAALGNSMILGVRMSDDAAVVFETAIREMEPNGVVAVSSMEDIMRNAVRRQRFQTLAMTAFAGTDWEYTFIHDQRVARLATVDDSGQTAVVPIVYAFEGAALYTPLDAKPKRVAATRLKRVRNINANPRVAIIIDAYTEDWRKLAWIHVRGLARVITTGDAYTTGIKLLHVKYPQYEHMPLAGRPLIAIEPTHIRSWRASDTAPSRS